jgi:phosphoribosylaminoimidazole-succinocarboxamide synthase
MIVRRAQPTTVEWVVRGYLAGSGWKEYQKTKTVCGVPLPAGLQNSSRLPEPILTPTTKEEHHDLPLTPSQARERVGPAIFDKAQPASLALFKRGTEVLEKAGIILADTKFEFGVTDAGELILIDEVMTPDSSRYWPMDQYAPGGPQPSFDKQFVRDYLERIHWNKQPPVPSLPEDVVVRTRDKYLEAFRRLTGRELD